MVDHSCILVTVLPLWKLYSWCDSSLDYLNAIKLIVGAIYGSGTNGVYSEKLSKMRKLKNFTSESPDAMMLVNTEWAGFDSTVILQKFLQVEACTDCMN